MTYQDSHVNSPSNSCPWRLLINDSVLFIKTKTCMIFLQATELYHSTSQVLLYLEITTLTLPVATMVRIRSMDNSKLLLLLFAGMLTLSILSSPAVAYGNGEIFDISHKITSELPTFDSKNGLGHFIWLVSSIKNGSLYNSSEFKLGTHTGTHVDAPSHFFEDYYEKGFDVTTLSLQTLNGPALVVDVPKNKNITAEVMKSLNIPRGVHRVLFKTLNTDRRLMHKKEFASDFTGFRKDGAQWLVDNTDIKLVGLDYLSVSAYVDAAPTHHIFLKKREVVLVEGLNLDGIKPGKYTVHCLPLRMVGAEGCPARCILTS